MIPQFKKKQKKNSCSKHFENWLLSKLPSTWGLAEKFSLIKIFMECHQIWLIFLYNFLCGSHTSFICSCSSWIPLAKIWHINFFTHSYTSRLDYISCSAVNRSLFKFFYIIQVYWTLAWWLECSPGDLGSIPGRVIPKTQKMLLDASLLNTQHYKVQIKGKVEQSRERSSTLPFTLVQ